MKNLLIMALLTSATAVFAGNLPISAKNSTNYPMVISCWEVTWAGKASPENSMNLPPKSQNKMVIPVDYAGFSGYWCKAISKTTPIKKIQYLGNSPGPYFKGSKVNLFVDYECGSNWQLYQN